MRAGGGFKQSEPVQPLLLAGEWFNTVAIPPKRKHTRGPLGEDDVPFEKGACAHCALACLLLLGFSLQVRLRR